MVDNNGLTPNNIVFDAPGDILVSGPIGAPEAKSRGSVLTLGPSGHVLASNGVNEVWVPYSNNPGTVTSVTLVGNNGITTIGGPITGAGTFTVGLAYPSLLQNTGNVSGTINLSTGSFTLNAPVSAGTVSSVALSSSTNDLVLSGINPITSSGTIDLALTTQALVPGSYNVPTITVNSKGIITAITTGGVSTSQLIGNLSLSLFNGGTGASSTTFWSGTGGPSGTGAWLSIIGTAIPNALGTAAAGSSSLASAQDHVHQMPSSTDIGALPISGGTLTGSLVVSGNLTVNGTTTTINSTTLDVTDASITMGNVITPTDATANGGGIILLGATTKSLIWNNDTFNAWTSSENLNLVVGREYTINNTSVLSSTTLGSSVVNSSLTSVGTLANLTVTNPISGNITGNAATVTTNANLTGMVTSVGNAATVVTNANLTGDVTSVGNATTLTHIPAISGANLTNLTAANISSGTAGINISGNAATVTTNANLTGMVTSVGNATTIASHVVTYAKIQQASAQTLIGNPTGSLANIEEITLGSGLSFSGSTLISTGTGGTVTSVSGTGTVSGITLSGTVTSTGNLTLGGTLSVAPSDFASQTANTFLAAPLGVAGVPSFRAIDATDIPTLNQNTTGTAANITAVTNASLTTLSSLSLPYSQLSGAVPTWNQNTTGSSASSPYAALTGAAAQGDILYYTGSAWTVLAPGTNGQYLRTGGTAANPSWATASGSGTVTSVTFTGDGTVLSSTPSSAVTSSGTLSATLLSQSAHTVLAGPTTGTAAPTFRSLAATDIPTLNQNTTGTAANITATSNSSLTTLSVLSLPNAQVSGTSTQVQYIKSTGFMGGDSTLTFNDATKVLSATTFSGALTGNVTGNVSGSAGTVATISGLISAGSNITITGSGTSGSPYSIASTGGGGGGTVNSGTAGQVAFYATSTTAVSGAGTGTTELYWDNTNHRLGVNNTSPAYPLDVTGAINTTTTYDIGGVVVLNTSASMMAIGQLALTSLSSGSNNVGIGYQAAGGITSGTNNTAIGITAMQSGNGTRNTVVGSGAMTAVSGGDNVAIGCGVGSGGSYTIAIGSSLSSSLGALRANTGNYNIAMGLGSMAGSITGAQNIGIGAYTLAANGASTNNVALGYSAMGNMTVGSNNTVIGSNAMSGGGSSTPANNTVMGQNAAFKLTGSSNTIFGNNAASTTLTTGSFNILIGGSASIDTASASTSNYLAIGLAMDGTTGENSNTANAGIRSLGYVAEKNYTFINSGTASTISNASSTVIIDGPTTYTLTAPAAPVEGQLLKIAAGTTAVTTFSFIANGSQTVNNTPATLAAFGGIEYIYRDDNTTWYRLR